MECQADCECYTGSAEAEFAVILPGRETCPEEGAANVAGIVWAVDQKDVMRQPQINGSTSWDGKTALTEQGADARAESHPHRSTEPFSSI